MKKNDMDEHTKKVLWWLSEYKSHRSAGESIDSALTHIHTLGAYTPMAIRIVKDAEGITTEEASEEVFTSAAFSEYKETWKKFWEETDRLLDED